MQRQIFDSGKWVKGIPSISGQRYRYESGGRWHYGVYSPEVVTPEHDPAFRITKRAFYNRLLAEEEIAIDLSSFAATVEAAAIRRFMRRVDSSPFVDLKFNETINGVNAMESLGLLKYAGRASEILNEQPTEDEIFRGDT